MRLSLLGTGNAGQVPVYNCNCIACARARVNELYRRGPCSALLEVGAQCWLIDSGLMDLTTRFPPSSLNGILQTHYHADHAQGLLHLRWGADMVLPVLGPPDPDGFADLYKHPGILDFSKTLQPFVTVDLGDARLTPVPLTHSKLAYGYVVYDGQQRYAYLTDTVGLPSETIDYLKQRPVDLMVLDCSFAPRSQPHRNHNDLNTALHTIEQLPVKQAVLTHIGHSFDAWLMQYGAQLPSHVLVGRDGDVFQ
ncbi:MAG TPA: phosphonate metabolism protein PhnP [Eoetvoesiella sp.]